MKKLVFVLTMLVASTSAAQSVVSGVPRCGVMGSPLVDAAINTACQADTTEVATASLNCTAKEWEVTAGVQFTFLFKYTRGGANTVTVYLEEAGSKDFWVPYDAIDFATVSDPQITATGGFDKTVSADAKFSFSFKPRTKYFRLMWVASGGSPSTSDVLNAVEVCTQ